MESKVFSYKSEIMLEQFDESLRLSPGFDKKELLETLKGLLKKQNFDVDESSVSFKIIDNELYLEGLASITSERKSIGFMSGK